MKQLTVSKDGQRLLLVLPNATPLRAAAQAIPGVKSEGVQGDLVAFSDPATPDATVSVLETFEPSVGKEHRLAVQALVAQYAALEEAASLKAHDTALSFNSIYLYSD